MTGHHLAHFNWGRLRAPVGDPLVAPFVDAVGRVNARAEAAPGFVWRSGNEAALGRAIGWDLFDDERVIASYSVWDSPEALRRFVYEAVHGAFLSRRSEWFEAAEGLNYALWWVPIGPAPDFAEARDRVTDLCANGPSARVFDFDTLARMGQSMTP